MVRRVVKDGLSEEMVLQARPEVRRSRHLAKSREQERAFHGEEMSI